MVNKLNLEPSLCSLIIRRERNVSAAASHSSLKVSFSETICFPFFFLMKVHLIKKQTIKQYMADNAQSRESFDNWLSIIGYADWEVPQDIVQTFGSADILGRGSKRVVFNINGNNYRMICAYYFGNKQVHLFVKWIGTHAAYDALCKKYLQYTVDDY